MENISIIILSCNNPYINISIDTLLLNMEANDEIIIVDDHSDSDYLNKLSKYEKNKNIKLYHAKKRGNRSHNRNIGASHSKNQILFFVDGDIVIYDNALDELRRSHASRKEVAFIGHKFFIHYSDIHFKIFSGINNFFELLQTKEGRKNLIGNKLFNDERAEFWKNKEYRDFFWLNYYTGACSIEKKIFDQIGGFDENFSTWGAEDVDLGYRISLCGKIGFINDMYAIHIPHPRDILKIERSNAQNVLYMLQKYNTWEFEVMYTFISTPDVFISIYNIIKQMRMIYFNNNFPEISADSLIFDTVSMNYPNGIITYTDSKNNKCSINSLGLTTLFKEKQFKKAYVSDHIFTYPSIMISRILQEMLRIADEILIYKTNDTIRIDWNGKVTLAKYYSNNRLCYHSDDIMDFTFKEQGNFIQITSSIIP